METKTVTKTDVKKYLAYIEKYRCLIRCKLEERAMWQSMATGTTASADGERVQTSGAHDKMANAVISCVEIDESISFYKERLNNILRTLEQLEPEHYEMLHMIYVRNMSIKEVQVARQRSASWVHEAHKKALEELQRILEK